MRSTILGRVKTSRLFSVAAIRPSILANSFPAPEIKRAVPPFQIPNRIGISARYTSTLFPAPKDYSPQVAAKIGNLKRIAKFQHNVVASIQSGNKLIRESALFSQLVLECAVYNGLSESQRDFTFRSVRYYNNLPLNGSEDNEVVKAQIAVSNLYYNAHKKSTLTELKKGSRRYCRVI